MLYATSHKVWQMKKKKEKKEVESSLLSFFQHSSYDILSRWKNKKENLLVIL